MVGTQWWHDISLFLFFKLKIPLTNPPLLQNSRPVLRQAGVPWDNWTTSNPWSQFQSHVPRLSHRPDPENSHHQIQGSSGQSSGCRKIHCRKGEKRWEKKTKKNLKIISFNVCVVGYSMEYQYLSGTWTVCIYLIARLLSCARKRNTRKNEKEKHKKITVSLMYWDIIQIFFSNNQIIWSFKYFIKN